MIGPRVSPAWLKTQMALVMAGDVLAAAAVAEVVAAEIRVGEVADLLARNEQSLHFAESLRPGGYGEMDPWEGVREEQTALRAEFEALMARIAAHAPFASLEEVPTDGDRPKWLAYRTWVLETARALLRRVATTRTDPPISGSPETGEPRVRV